MNWMDRENTEMRQKEEGRLPGGMIVGRRKTAAGFVLFLALMWVCTLVSKTIYASKLPQVQAAEAEKKRIEHIVESDGIIKQGSDRAIHTLAGLRVEQIRVRAGDEVEKGEVLFTLDKEDLAEIIGQKELEAAKLEYQIGDLQRNRQLDAEEKSRQQERAGEDYVTAAEAAEKIKKLTDWKPQYTFEQGIAETIEWIGNHLNFYKCDIYNV